MELQSTSASLELARGKVPTAAATNVEGIEKEAVPEKQRREERGAMLQDFFRLISHWRTPPKSSIQSSLHACCFRQNGL